MNKNAQCQWLPFFIAACALCGVVALAGCTVREAVKPEPKKHTEPSEPLYATKADMDHLHEHVAELTAVIEEGMKQYKPAAVAQAAAAPAPSIQPVQAVNDAGRFTGILAHCFDGCIRCEQFKGHGKQTKGWTFGPGPQFDVQYVTDTDTDGHSYPWFEVMVDGNVTRRLEGFNGTKTDFDRIMRFHPLYDWLDEKPKQAMPTKAPPAEEPAPSGHWERRPIEQPTARGHWERKATGFSSPERHGFPQSALAAHGPDWSWPGRTTASLKRHLETYPHQHSPQELAGLSPAQMRHLHSAEHRLNAQRTGDYSPVVPSQHKPFYGRIQAT